MSTLKPYPQLRSGQLLLPQHPQLVGLHGHLVGLQHIHPVQSAGGVFQVKLGHLCPQEHAGVGPDRWRLELGLLKLGLLAHHLEFRRRLGWALVSPACSSSLCCSHTNSSSLVFGVPDPTPEAEREAAAAAAADTVETPEAW